MRQVYTRWSWKYYLFFIMSFLPLSAFAAESTPTPSGISNFFTPPPGDLSVYLLGRVFGVVGNVLHGSGNQLIGTLMGIFNAAWVVAIGLAILWTVWSSVISAAGSGEMMGGHGKGKKAAFTIIRIVIGFSLVVPSMTTGYSLAQTMVMWVAIQGVGLGGQVYERFHKYMETGVIVTAEPSTVENDLIPILPMNQTILESEICMYKLQSLLDKENKAKKEAQSGLGEVSDVFGPNNPTSKEASAGYSINEDYTITFGTRNHQYNAGDKNSHMFNNECGSIEFNRSMVSLANATVEDFVLGKVPQDALEAMVGKTGSYSGRKYINEVNLSADTTTPFPAEGDTFARWEWISENYEKVGLSAPPDTSSGTEESYRARLQWLQSADKTLLAAQAQSVNPTPVESVNVKDLDQAYLDYIARVQNYAQAVVLYQQAATTEAVLAMQPAASAIAMADIMGLDIKKPEDRTKIFNELQKKGGNAMAVSAISFATLFDPIRRKAQEGSKNAFDDRMKVLRDKGWMYTPIAILNYGYTEAQWSVSQFLPVYAGPKLDKIKDLTSSDMESLDKAVSLPGSDRYIGMATAYLYKINQHADLNKSAIDFGGGVDSVKAGDFSVLNVDAGEAINSACSAVVDGLASVGNSIKNALGGI